MVPQTWTASRASRDGEKNMAGANGIEPTLNALDSIERGGKR